MNDQAHGNGNSTVGSRRILVALDSSPESLSTLDAAADLAARLRVEIHGVFVEDADLLGLAEYPLVYSISAQSGRRDVLDRATVERTLRRNIATAREAVERAAGLRRIKSSFRVRRGRISAEVLESAGDRDLILVSRTGASISVIPLSDEKRVGTAAREVVRESRQSVLIIGERSSATGRVVVGYDGSASGDRALDAAAEIADRRGGDGITVLLLADDAARAQTLQEIADQHLTELGFTAEFRIVTQPSLNRLCQEASGYESGLLVLGAEQAIVSGSAAQELLERIACSVMLVR